MCGSFMSSACVLSASSGPVVLPRVLAAPWCCCQGHVPSCSPSLTFCWIGNFHGRQMQFIFLHLYKDPERHTNLLEFIQNHHTNRAHRLARQFLKCQNKNLEGQNWSWANWPMKEKHRFWFGSGFHGAGDMLVHKGKCSIPPWALLWMKSLISPVHLWAELH